VLFSYHSGKGAPGAGNREDEGATAGFSRENPLPHHPCWPANGNLSGKEVQNFEISPQSIPNSQKQKQLPNTQ